MRRKLVYFALVVLVIVEVLLFTTLLPDSLLKPLDKLLDRAFPAPQYDYHPNLRQELAFLRPYEIAFTGTLLVINGVAIALLWRRRKPKLGTSA